MTPHVVHTQVLKCSCFGISSRQLSVRLCHVVIYTSMKFVYLQLQKSAAGVGQDMPWNGLLKFLSVELNQPLLVNQNRMSCVVNVVTLEHSLSMLHKKWAVN